MGSTLEHGIYLPSEGEKNCYQGLASNWNKVDGALGDVAELKQLIENKFTKEIVTELPTEDINPYCIYMILKTDPETDNIYDEWVYINNAWEYLGNTKADMSQYYTKQEVNQLPAVASGVTATKVGNYDAHIANGDIHVTANDKTKWTNSANTVVLRLAKTTLTPSSSTNAFSNLDDSTALKVGDKVMDTTGVLFEVTAIDTQNSTFTIGTALIDLAQDSDVVHKSGDETIAGVKTITNSNLDFKSTSAEYGVSAGDSSVVFRDKNNRQTFKIYSRVFSSGLDNNLVSFFITQKVDNTYYTSNGIQLFTDTGNKNVLLRPVLANSNADGLSVSLGSSDRRWKSVYATNYYYGSNNVEFSTKFVTTDTNQTISGSKTFLDIPIPLKSSTAELGVTGGNTKVIFTDKNLLNLAGITFGNYGSSKLSYCRFHIYDKDSNNQEIDNFIEFSYVNNNQIAYFRPNKSNFVTLGTVNNRWNKVYADEYYYGSNNIGFSTKFVTTDTNQTISGNKTFSSDLYVANTDTTANIPNLNLRNYRADRGTTDTAVQTISFSDKNAKALTMLESRRISNGNTAINILCYNTDDNNNTVSGGVSIIKSKTDTNFAPNADNVVTCGRAFAKWSDVQTYKVNALEPSSLSLPSDRSARIDISSYFTNTGTGNTNDYSVPANGFIFLNLLNAFTVICYSLDGTNNVNYAQSYFRQVDGQIYILFPVRKNDTFRTLWTSNGGTITVTSAHFIPCQGNV